MAYQFPFTFILLTLAYASQMPEIAGGLVSDCTLACSFESGTSSSWKNEDKYNYGIGWAVVNKVPGVDTGHNSTGFMAIGPILYKDSKPPPLLRSCQRPDAGFTFQCLTFWYRFGDASSIPRIDDAATLYLKAEYDTSNILIWSSEMDIFSNPYNSWQQVKIALNGAGVRSLYFQLLVHRNTSEESVGIDGISTDSVPCSEGAIAPLERLAFVAAPTKRHHHRKTSTTATTKSPIVPGYSCDFEIDFCKWSNEMNEEMLSLWERTQNSSVSGTTCVIADHTKKTGAGYYLLYGGQQDATSFSSLMPAILETKVEMRSGFKCLSFWYWMCGRNIGRLTVKLVFGENMQMKLFEASGDKEANWNKAELNLDSINENYTIRIEAQGSNLSDGDIALDDFSMSTAACTNKLIPTLKPPADVFCDFELADLCGTTLQFSLVKKAGSFSWNDATGQTLGGSSLINDHTTNTPQGHFAVAKDGSRFAEAVMQSIEIDPKNVKCISFWYFLRLRTTDSFALKLTLLDQNGNDPNQLLLIENANSTKQRWTHLQADVPTSVDYQFILQFSATSSGGGTLIAVDDILLSTAPCARAVEGLMSRSLVSGQSSLTSNKNVLLGCSFTNGNACGWTLSGNWKITGDSSGRSVSKCSDSTLPDNCFGYITFGTLNAPPRLPSSAAWQIPNQPDTITTPVVNTTQSTLYCLRFFYKISGWFRDNAEETLNVYIKGPQSTANNVRLLGSFSGSDTNEAGSDGWLEERLSIVEQKGFQIFFEAKAGNTWVGSIALDGVELQSLPCYLAYF